MDYHKKPGVFVGMEDYDSVPIETSDTIGGSVFAWDDGNIAGWLIFWLPRVTGL